MALTEPAPISVSVAEQMRDDAEVPRPPARRFVGRGSELTTLGSLLVESAEGRPGVAILSGDAGVGKTRLLEELATRARVDGHTVLVGSCVQVGDFGLPYVPIIDALRAVEAKPEGAALLRDAAARRPTLGRLLPQLVDADSGAQGISLGDGLAQVQLFEAVHDVVLALAELAPVLFVIEDVHWADRSTRDLIAFLVRTMRVGRVTLVVSYRSDDVHRRHPLRQLLAELARRPDIEHLDLSPFSRAELAELLAGSSPGAIDAQLLERVFVRSEGNAFFAEELLQAADAAGTRPEAAGLPVALADVLLNRFESLSPPARATLRVAAVAGRRSPHELLVQAAEATPAITEEALREVVEAGILVTDGETYAFRHALLQEAAYGDLLPGERVRLHGRFAELLAKDRDSERLGAGVRTAELAHHLLASHDLAGAFDALIDAAAHAERMAAPAEALRHLEQALELAPRMRTVPAIDLLIRAAEAAAAAGDADRAVAHARASVAAADLGGDDETRSSTRERLARLQIEAGEPAAEAASEAVALLDDGLTTARAQALATWARTLMRIEPAKADQLLTESIAVADAIGADAIAADALVTRGLMARVTILPGDAEALFTEAVRRAAADPVGLRSQMRALRFAANYHLEQGQIDRALADADAGIALSEKAGLVWSSYGLDLRLLRGWALAARGDWDDVLRESLDAAYAPTSPGRVLATQALAVLVARGDPAADGLLDRLRGTGDAYAEIQLDLRRIELHLQRREFAEALAMASSPRSEFRHHGETEALLLATRATTALAELAALARTAGDLESAHAHAAQAKHYAQIAQGHANTRAGLPAAIALWSSWAAAEADRAAARDTPEDWAAVVGFAVESGRIEDVASASLQQARTALDAGRRDPATVEALQRALTIAGALAAAPLREQALDLARRARLEAEMGIVADSSVGSPNRAPAALTAREVEVLALLADGLTNRRIGRELFISEKTASVHVSNIIGKLGAVSRTEAVAVARRQGLLGA